MLNKVNESGGERERGIGNLICFASCNAFERHDKKKEEYRKYRKTFGGACLISISSGLDLLTLGNTSKTVHTTTP